MKIFTIIIALFFLSTSAFATVDQMYFQQCMSQTVDGYNCEKKCTFFFSNEPRTPTDQFNTESLNQGLNQGF